MENNEQNINQQFSQQFSGNPSSQTPVPNATAVLVLGIISIALCWCYGIVSLACGIIALVLAGKGMTAYKENPSAYSTASFNNLKAGKICAIIGMCLGILYLIIIGIYIAVLGAAFSALPWDSFK